MLPELPKLEKPRLRTGIFRLLVLNFVLNFALTAWPPRAEAQVPGAENTGGVISGTVVSVLDNRPMGQVAVTLKSQSAGISRSVLTDYDGYFEVRELPFGTYEILVEEAGHDRVRREERLEGPPLKIMFYLKGSKPLLTKRTGNSVSIRELKMPGKALDEFRKGLESLGKTDFAGSLRHFRSATQAFPGYYEAYYHEGAVDLKLGHREEAMQAFQKAVDLSDGRYAWAQFGMGYLLCLEGKPSEAETVIRRGLEVEADLPDGYVILAILQLQQNRLEEAEQNAHAALLYNPNFADAYLVLSDVNAHRREYAQQLQHLDAYLKLEPTGPASGRVQLARKMVLGMLANAHAPD